MVVQCATAAHRCVHVLHSNILLATVCSMQYLMLLQLTRQNSVVLWWHSLNLPVGLSGAFVSSVHMPAPLWLAPWLQGPAAVEVSVLLTADADWCLLALSLPQRPWQPGNGRAPAITAKSGAKPQPSHN